MDVQEAHCLLIYRRLQLLLCGTCGRHISHSSCGEVILCEGICQAFPDFACFCKLSWSGRFLGILKSGEQTLEAWQQEADAMFELNKVRVRFLVRRRCGELAGKVGFAEDGALAVFA